MLDDAAQGFGGTYKGKPIGTFGHATATSFFPAKPLGCYGDGGAVLTDDDELLAILKSVRVHGGGSDKYDNVRLGLTARLDTIQAAVLIEKLKIFPDEIATRNRVAQRYNQALKDVVTVPVVPAGYGSVWAQYTIKLKAGQRDRFAKALQAEGIPTAIYYAKPLHLQTAYRDFPVAQAGLAGQRAAGRRGHQPADARLSRRADPGSHRRRGAAGVALSFFRHSGAARERRARNPATNSEAACGFRICAFRRAPE